MGRHAACATDSGKSLTLKTVANPYLTVEQKVLKEPRWEHLAMWDHLRKTYLGLDPDPLDREASRRVCGG